MNKAIEEQKTEQKFMFQIVDKATGRRSEPFVTSWSDLRYVLSTREMEESPIDDDYILLVAVLDGKETIIPSTPLITIRTFMSYEENEKEAQNNG